MIYRNISILLLIFIGVLFGCDNSQETSVMQDAVTPPVNLATPVDFTAELNADLQKQGFILANREIKAPDFTLKDLSGNPKTLSAYKGKIVVLNFWGVWCPYCVQEMPSMQKFYDQLKGDKFEILAVDVNDTPQTVKDFISANGYNFQIVLDADLSVTGMYGIQGFPTTFIVDGDGYLRAMFVGALNWNTPEMISVFNRLIAGIN